MDAHAGGPPRLGGSHRLVEGPSRLGHVTAFALAQPLAALHYALTYHRIIFPAFEFRWEAERALPSYLKMLLRSSV
jgi:hypothetical protein